MPCGEVLITANTDIGVVLLAIKDSQVQWIHDLHEGRRDPPNYHPLALIHHPDYGYYIIGTYREDHRNLRDATYHIMRFTGMKGASSTN